MTWQFWFKNLYSTVNIYKFTDRLHLQIKFIHSFKKNTTNSVPPYKT